MQSKEHRSSFELGMEFPSFESARRAAVKLAEPRGCWEEVPLSVAVGRVLAAAIVAPLSLPTMDQAAMDGYALCMSGLKSPPAILPVVGRTSAGELPGMLVDGTAHRIMTGTGLPAGADTVVMQERTLRSGDVLHPGSRLSPW
jgi:molybdopterin molybdotransferase